MNYFPFWRGGKPMVGDLLLRMAGFETGRLETLPVPTAAPGKKIRPLNTPL